MSTIQLSLNFKMELILLVCLQTLFIAKLRFHSDFIRSRYMLKHFQLWYSCHLEDLLLFVWLFDRATIFYFDFQHRQWTNLLFHLALYKSVLSNFEVKDSSSVYFVKLFFDETMD